MSADSSVPRTRAAQLRRSNVRTAIVLVAIALVFFAGILLAKYMGDARTAMMVLGAAVLLFLVLAIGRNLRKGK